MKKWYFWWLILWIGYFLNQLITGNMTIVEYLKANSHIYEEIMLNINVIVDFLVFVLSPVVILICFIIHWINIAKGIRYYRVYISDDHNILLKLGAKNLKISRTKALSQIIELFYSKVISNNPSIFDNIEDYDLRKL